MTHDMSIYMLLLVVACICLSSPRFTHNKIIDSVKGAFGFDRAGGSADARGEFEFFSGSIDELLTDERARLAEEGANPFGNDIGGAANSLRSFLGVGGEFQSLLGESRARAGGLAGLLRTGALSSVAPARQAAASAARTAAGGRGGLAFGGGAANVAGRAAQGAASQQAAALAQAQIGAEQFNVQTIMNTAQLGLGAEQSLAGANLAAANSQAGLEEARRNRLQQLSALGIATRTQLASNALSQGLSGDTAAAGRRNQTFNNYLTGAQNAATAAAGAG